MGVDEKEADVANKLIGEVFSGVPDPMPRGYRGAVLALGLILLALPLKAQERPGAALEREPLAAPERAEDTTTSEDGGPGESQNTPSVSTFLQGIEAAIRDLKAEVSEQDRRWEHEREKRDLNAQEEMALWAEGVFWATAATVALTFIALVAIIRTLHHTRRAADYAGDMTNEAKAATQIASKTADDTIRLGVKQVRAYVGITDVRLTNYFAGAPPVIIFALKNSGVTPGNIIRCLTTVILSKDPNGVKVFLRSRRSGSRGVIPGASAFGDNEVPMRVLTADEIKSIEEGETFIVFGGAVWYRDVFGKMRRSVTRAYVELHRISDNGRADFVNSTRNNRSS